MKIYLLYSSHEHHGNRSLEAVFSSVEHAKSWVEKVESGIARRRQIESPVINWYESPVSLMGYSPSYNTYEIIQSVIDPEPVTMD